MDSPLGQGKNIQHDRKSSGLVCIQAAGLGRLAMGQEQGNIFQQQQLGLTGNQAGLQRLQSRNSVSSANLGLDDLLSQLRFQQASQQAGQKGQAQQAVGGLLQNVGGGVLGIG